MSDARRPLSVVFVTPKNPLSATSRYRCHHLAEALAPQVTVAIHAITDTRFVLKQTDIVVLHRLRYHGEADRVIKAARAVGAIMVASIDDLIFSPEYAFQVGYTSPIDDPAFYRYHRAELDDHRRTMEECDAILASTEFLADSVRQALDARKPVYCVRNFLNAEMVALAGNARDLRARRLATNTGTRVIAYLSGSPTHDLDFAEIAPTLAKVMTSQEETRLMLVGTVSLPPVLASFADAGRVRRHPFVPWRDLFALTAQADITLAPLDTSRLFNHAKSEIKALEAGAVGVPTLLSQTVGATEPGIGIACRTAADWENKLTRLLQSDAAQLEGSTVWNRIKDQGTIVANRERVQAIFAEIGGNRRSNAQRVATVTRPWRERISESLRETEAAWFVRKHKLDRHWRLLEEDLRKQGRLK